MVSYRIRRGISLKRRGGDMLRSVAKKERKSEEISQKQEIVLKQENCAKAGKL